MMKEDLLQGNYLDDEQRIDNINAHTNNHVSVTASYGSLMEEQNCEPASTHYLDRTALHSACEGNDNLALIKYKVEEHKVHVAAKDEEGNSPLNVAASSGNLAIVIEEKKCSPTSPGYLDRTPLHNACINDDNLAVVKYLAEEQDVDLIAEDERGDTPLNVAASCGCLAIVKYLIEEKRCSPASPGYLDRTPLHNACEGSDNLSVVKYLVEEQEADLNARDEEGNTPLNVAASSGSLAIVKYLIEEKKCSPTSPGYLGRTPLHNACEGSDNLDVVKYLVEEQNGALSAKDEKGNTAMHVAAFSGCLVIMKYLIEEKRCSPALPGYLGRTPLHNACEEYGNLSIVKYLVEEQEADLNARDEEGNTPLNVAASCGSLAIVKYLIEEKKCSPTLPGYLDRTPLHNACEGSDNLDVVKYLVEEQNGDLDSKDEQGYTPLNVSTSFGSLAIVKYLIEEKKCSPTSPGYLGRTPLHNACINDDNLAVVKYLAEEQDVDLIAEDERGDTPLNVAASSGSLGIMKYLIEEKKCNPACAGYLFGTLLHSACENSDNLAVVKYLIEKQGVDLNVKDKQGNTPLNVAASCGSLAIVKYLITRRNCSPVCPGFLCRTPLHNACEKDGNLDMVKYLVEKQEVDLNIKDAEGNTSMHVAALYGNLVILKYLIEDRKCSPMYPGCLSRTPLHCACEGNDNLVMVKYLVEEQRVDLNAKDEQGNTPLNVAAFSGSLSIMTYLIEERYCSLECPGRLCRTPLHNACQHNDNLAMVKYLVEKKGVNMNVKDEQENTPLNVAAFSGNLAILKYLIDEQNCSSICLGYLSRTLLHNACERNDNIAMVKYLVEGQGVDLNMKDKQGNSPLNVAAFSGSLVILKYLINEQRCSSMCLGYLSRTLLHNACERNDNIAMVKYLVEEQGAYLNVKDDNDSTALNLATLSGSLTILRYLIEERNCSPTCPDQWGRTLLHDACQINDNLHVVNYLVEELGVDPYTRDDEGNTPLNVAASCGALISLRYLVEDRKCDPACSNYLGRNLLHSACTANSENLAMVKYLVESLRIDSNAMDDCGLSPLDIATTFANDSIAMYLKQKMGIISAPIQYVRICIVSKFQFYI